MAQAVRVPRASSVIARCSAAARMSGAISTGPPSAMALIAACAASSTTPPMKTASSAVRWKTRARHAQADVAVPVRRDRPAGDDACRRVQHLVDEILVHPQASVARMRAARRADPVRCRDYG